MYAAQETPKIDATRAEKDPVRTETRVNGIESEGR
jgi:hypothetical protein